MKKWLWWCLFLPLLTGCGAQMRVLPVGRGHTQVNASVGGPLAKVNTLVVPFPYAMGGITYGLTERVDVHADVHVLAAIFKTAGLTPGVTVFPKSPLPNWVPSFSADALIFSDFKSARVYPEMKFALARPLGKWTPYAGVKATFQTGHRPAVIPLLMVGTGYRFQRSALYAELQWVAADRDNRWAPVEYQGISHRGALAPHIGWSLDIGGGKK